MNKQDRYRQIEKFITVLLLGAALLFLIFLISSGYGIIWLKVICSIITLLLCGLSLAVLYLTRLLVKPRSLWMTTAAGAIVFCLLFSLILNFPSPV